MSTHSLPYGKTHKKLYSSLPSGLIYLRATDQVIRNGDVSHQFRQHSHFLYMTGIDQPGYQLLLDPKAKKSHLFIPDLNRKHQIWEGRQETTAQAKKRYKVDFVHYASDFNALFNKLSKKYKNLHVIDNAHKPKVTTKLKIDSKSLDATLNGLRLFKSDAEIKLMKKANEVSALGHIAAMKTAKPGLKEYQVQAAMSKEFLSAGAQLEAYIAIVGTGANASILHYSANNATCKSGDLLLIDAGCEWQGYASDITRTFPVSGKFTKVQKEIYEIVLDTQKLCIKMVKSGTSMIDIHMASRKRLAQGLWDLGILKQSIPLEEHLSKDIINVFYPHGIGHLLGLDVHDVGAPKKQPKKKGTKRLRTSLSLKPGMVVTVEPGLYFIEAYFDSKTERKRLATYIDWKIADRYRSVGGIRIEDDVLVTKSGNLNLTKVPKEIKDIEKVMRS